MHWLFPGGTHQQISLEISVKIQKKNCDAVYRTARGPEKLWATVRHICVRSVPAWYMPMGTTLQNVNR